MSQGIEYTINIDSEKLRERIKAMEEAGEFRDLFNVGFSGSSFWAKMDRSEESPGYRTRFIIKPQENSVLLRINNEYGDSEEFPAPFLAWDKIRRDLGRSGYEIRDVTGFELTAVFEHSYMDPGTIRNPNHRKIIRALIEAELSPERVNQKDIAERLGFSESRVSEIKKLYLRPEFQEQK